MDFVTFDFAKKLKEKGFDWETSNVYERNTLACRYEDYPKPTISQVLKWLREKKKIFLHIDVYENDKFDYFFGIAVQGDETWERRYVGEKDYKTYEQAAIAGIEYVLDNLI